VKSGWRASSLSCNARREKRDGFDQALDVRVGAIQTVHTESCRDARIASANSAPMPAQVLELPVVVLRRRVSIFRPRSPGPIADDDVSGFERRCWYARRAAGIG